VVLNSERIVFGLLREGELEIERDGSVEQVMRRGPSTFRPNVPIEEMAEFMHQHDLANAPITASDGRLVGLLTREAAIRVAHEQHEHDQGSKEPTE